MSAPAQTNTAPALSPEPLLQLAFGFWAPKVLLAATELGVFTELARGPLSLEEASKRLGLHPRGAVDFLDTLVSMGLLERQDGVYANTPVTAAFLDRNRKEYVGGVIEMVNRRLWSHWGNLEQALRTGRQQNEAKDGGDTFEAMYADPELLRTFLGGMTGISLPVAKAMARQFPWSEYRSFADIGTAQGAVPAALALAHEHLSGSGFDLPPVRPVFEEYVAQFGLNGRVRFREGDFFKDPLPGADVLIMGHILHDWDLETKRMLLAKAHAALPRGGALIVYDAMIDDERRRNTFGLLMSLNMLIETPGGFDYTGAQCVDWMHAAGFRRAEVQPLPGAHSMAIGIK